MSKTELIRENIKEEIAQILDHLVYEFVPDCDAEDVARRIINHIESRGGELK